MPLVRLPTPCTLKDIYVGEGWDPATTVGQLAGATKPPTDFVVPAYQIAQMEQFIGGGRTTGQYMARLSVTRRAKEGNNTSIYLSEGLYETNYTLDNDAYKAAEKDPNTSVASWLVPWKASQPRVYFVMPTTIAEMNRQAEGEHCSDFLRAYHLTIHALERALDKIADAPSLPFASAQGARAARIDQLRNALPIGLRDVAESINLCGQKYLDLCKKSKTRDEKNWHSWGLKLLGLAPKVPAEGVEYLTGKQRQEGGRIYLEYTLGQAEVGRHTSESIIKF